MSNFVDGNDLADHIDHDVVIFTDQGRVSLYCETCGEPIYIIPY